MRQLGRLAEEDVLHHQELQGPEPLLHVGEVRVGEHGVLAHDVHGAQPAIEDRGHHLDHGEAWLGREIVSPQTWATARRLPASVTGW